MSGSWVGSGSEDPAINTETGETEVSASTIRMLDEEGQQGLLFQAIRACDLHAIRNILQVNRALVNKKMFGFEGTDVYEVIKNSKSKRCYSYTGQEKDGFFYPLHVSSEAGHKNLTLLLVKAGAETLAQDYRGLTAEEKANGAAVHAFYELRGMRFESKERYQGPFDRNNMRHGQGVLYFKPEGYKEVEKVLFRGGFKKNLYHGHGTLYFEGSDTIYYTGRFKAGLKHGRGIEFDRQGQKIYQGTFREDKREGRGEEFSDGVRTYRGEFSDNKNHGFGVAYYQENAKYFGRFENGGMSGVGIYCHPNGDRFEGMFFNNKPDGPGSFYEIDPFTGNSTGTHAVWQAGRKIKDSQFPFAPTVADLPESSSKNMFSMVLNLQEDEELETGVSESFPHLSLSEPSYTHQTPSQSLASHSSDVMLYHHPAQSSVKFVNKTFAYFDGENALQGINKHDRWKIQLGKYLKLPLRDARSLGLYVPDAIFNSHTNEAEGEDVLADEVEEEEEPEEEELASYYFMDCVPLFVAYMYVSSAAKVFEERAGRGNEAGSGQIQFESVRHIVNDAVDSFNENWESAFRQQQQMLVYQEAKKSASDAPENSKQVDNNVEVRKRMFMSEKEKKEEMILKQRAELAIKKGTAELDVETERKIGEETLKILESELSKLLVEEIEQREKNNLIAASSDLHSVNSGESNALNRKRVLSNVNNKMNNSNVPPTDPNQINIDDLFDFDYLQSTVAASAAALEASNKDDGSAEDGDEAGNEFAAELLYMLRTAVALM